MVSVYRNDEGWFVRKEVEIGYYSSLGDAMSAAYACENGTATRHGLAAGRDQAGQHR